MGDKPDKTGRNGCGPGANGIMNEGIVPPSCRPGAQSNSSSTDLPIAAPTSALPGSCASCDLVPCGHCQEGCAESACTYESDVDKPDKTGRNGCGAGANGILNEGIVPPSCRVSSLTAPASSMLILAATVDTTFSQPLTMPEQEIVQSTFKSHLETDYLWYSSLSLVFTVSMQSSRRNGMSTDNPSTNTSTSGGPTDPPTAAPFVSCSLAAFLAEECVAYTLSAIAETNNPSAASATLTPGLSNDLAFGLSAALPGVTNSVGSVITSVTTASPTTSPTTSISTTAAPQTSGIQAQVMIRPIILFNNLLTKEDKLLVAQAFKTQLVDTFGQTFAEGYHNGEGWSVDIVDHNVSASVRRDGTISGQFQHSYYAEGMAKVYENGRFWSTAPFFQESFATTLQNDLHTQGYPSANVKNYTWPLVAGETLFTFGYVQPNTLNAESTEDDGDEIGGGGMEFSILIGIAIGAIAIATVVGAIAYHGWLRQNTYIGQVEAVQETKGQSLPASLHVDHMAEVCLSETSNLDFSESSEQSSKDLLSSGSWIAADSFDNDEASRGSSAMVAQEVLNPMNSNIDIHQVVQPDLQRRCSDLCADSAPSA